MIFAMCYVEGQAKNKKSRLIEYLSWFAIIRINVGVFSDSEGKKVTHSFMFCNSLEILACIGNYLHINSTKTKEKNNEKPKRRDAGAQHETE